MSALSTPSRSMGTPQGFQKVFVTLTKAAHDDGAEGYSFDVANNFEVFNAALSAAAIFAVLLHLLLSAFRHRRIQLGKDDDALAVAEIVNSDDITAAAKQPILSEPVQEEEYMGQVRRQRNLVLGFSVISLGLALATLVELKRVRAPSSAVLSLSIDAVLWLISSGLLLTRLSTQGQWPRILQLNALLSATLITHGLRIVIPPPLSWDTEDGVPIQLPALFTGVLLWEQAAAFVVAFAAWVANGLTPSGPPRVVPSPNPGTVPTINVVRDETAGASMLSYLFFAFCYSIVKAASVKDQLAPDDVPYVSDSYRASGLHTRTQQAFARMALKDSGKKTASSSSNGYRTEPDTTATDEASLKKQSSRRAWRLLKVLVSTNKSLIIPMLICTVFAAGSFYVPWVLLWVVIQSLEQSEQNKEPLSIAIRQNIVYAVAFLVSQILCAWIVSHAWGLSSTQLKARFRSQLSVLLLNKSLHRKDTTTLKDNSKTSGEDGEGPKKSDDDDDDDTKGDSPAEFATKSKIITLQTVDIQRVEEFSLHIFVLINCPCELIVGGWLAYRVLGISALIGLATSFTTAPLVYLITSRIEKIQEKIMAARDTRSSLMNEAFQAIRMVKFCSWERKVSERISKPRELELKYQRQQYFLNACSELFFSLSPMIVIVASFSFYSIVFGHRLTPSRAFPGFSVLTELRFALTQLPDTVSSGIQSWTSLKRIATYLDSPEVDVPDSIDLSSEVARQADTEIRLQNATIGWPIVMASPTSQAASVAPVFRLRDVTCTFAPKQLNLICGKLGSGKSLLLAGLLGEADLLAGSLKCPRSTPDAIAQSEDIRIYTRGEWISPVLTGYVPQSAFLTNNSLRNNILFGLPMIRERYDAVLEACALLPDLALFEDGDEVEIGEGGIGLSGGQKARVSLARAVYSRAQTLLLDDVLSAVDAHTAAHIHKELLQGPLLKDRTVLLVSHQVQLIAPSAASVLVLDNGAVKFQGQASEFLSSVHYSGLLTEQEDKEDERLENVKDKATKDPSKADGGISEKAAPSTAATDKDDGKGPDAPAKVSPRKLVEEEGRNVGSIGLKTWKRYLNMAGGKKVILVLLSIIFPSLWELVSSWWLRAFSSDARHGSDAQHPVGYWMKGYTALVLFGCVMQFVKWLSAYSASLRASRVMFEAALEAVLRAGTSWHDKVPRGRLLNRFTHDQEQVDSSLATDFVMFIDQGVGVLFAIVAVTIGGGPIFLLVVCLMSPIYLYVAKFFARAARDLRRLQQTTKSPVVQSFADVVNGVAVVRAFGASATTLSCFFDQLDNSTRYNFFGRQCNRWINLIFSSSTAVLYFVATSVIMISGADAALAAFALTFLLNLGHSAFFFVMCYTEMETAGVSVERLVEYADTPSEAALIVEPRPPAAWPHAGAVSFENLRLRYAADLPEVLKGVTFDISAGQKVGIVGPTGCGKSTTVTSLFRLIDNFSDGRIVIDGIDISKIGLEDLRSRLMIVPQDPVILSGSLRDSIDVFQEHSDEEINAALKKVHLLGSSDPNVSSLSRVVAQEGANAEEQNKNVFEDLTYHIAEGGSNLSNGQRQLLCMARALLGRSKIVVFDESSSSVDVDADELITATLQEEFSNCTVITIAHRLRTIMHSDRVVVMDKGTVTEFASPAELLQRPDSHFYKLCAASGKAEFDKLRELAGLSSAVPSSSSSSVKAGE